MDAQDAASRQVLDAAAELLRRRNAPIDATTRPPRPSPVATVRSGWEEGSRSEIELSGTRRLLEDADFSSQVGDMPPQPATLRGRIGGVFVLMVRKALFWYTAQIRSFQGLVRDAAREQMIAFQRINGEQQRQATTIAALLPRIDKLERDDRLDLALKQVDALQEAIRRLEARLDNRTQDRNGSC